MTTRLSLAGIALLSALLVASPAHADAERIVGTDRYDTAAQLALANFHAQVPVVFIASGESYTDGLAAGPAAAHEGGPLLLTRHDELPGSTADALDTLK